MSGDQEFRALRFLQLGIQFLDLSQKVAEEIHKSGNQLATIHEGFLTMDELEAAHEQETRWADYNNGIPIFFNFYHGIELLLKGVLVAEGKSIRGVHSISNLVSEIEGLVGEQEFISSIREYLDEERLPAILLEFIRESKINIDQWYQAFKYPEGIGKQSSAYAHSRLLYTLEAGAEFYGKLAKDITNIRVSCVQFVTNTYESENIGYV